LQVRFALPCAARRPPARPLVLFAQAGLCSYPFTHRFSSPPRQGASRPQAISRRAGQPRSAFSLHRACTRATRERVHQADFCNRHHDTSTHGSLDSRSQFVCANRSAASRRTRALLRRRMYQPTSPALAARERGGHSSPGGRGVERAPASFGCPTQSRFRNNGTATDRDDLGAACSARVEVRETPSDAPCRAPGSSDGSPVRQDRFPCPRVHGSSFRNPERLLQSSATAGPDTQARQQPARAQGMAPWTGLRRDFTRLG